MGFGRFMEQKDSLGSPLSGEPRIVATREREEKILPIMRFVDAGNDLTPFFAGSLDAIGSRRCLQSCRTACWMISMSVGIP